MATDPVEIKLTLDTSGVKRDLERMKRDMKEAQGAKPSGGFQADLKMGGSAPPRSLNSPAFPSGSGSGGGADPNTLSNLAQKEIAKTIGGTVKKAVETEVKGINWQQVMRMFMQNGAGGAGKELLFQAGSKAAGAIEGAAAEGSAFAGAASGALAALSTVALVAVLAPLIADKLVDDAGFVQSLSRALDIPADFGDVLSKIRAEVIAPFDAAKQGFSLEEKRHRLGQNIDAASLGSDFDKLRELNVFDRRMKDAIDARNQVNKIQTAGVVTRELVKGFTKGIGL